MVKPYRLLPIEKHPLVTWVFHWLLAYMLALLKPLGIHIIPTDPWIWWKGKISTKIPPFSLQISPTSQRKFLHPWLCGYIPICLILKSPIDWLIKSKYHLPQNNLPVSTCTHLVLLDVILHSHLHVRLKICPACCLKGSKDLIRNHGLLRGHSISGGWDYQSTSILRVRLGCRFHIF